MSGRNPAGLVRLDEPGIDGSLFRAGHLAMATEYEIIIRHTDSRYAGQAAFAAFEELVKLEQELSRFIENSDISRINTAAPKVPVLIGPAAMDCLEEAQILHRITTGAFDPGAGKIIQQQKTGRIGTAPLVTGGTIADLRIDRSNNMVSRLNDSVDLDLGAIGKGFALDRMNLLLREWSVEDFLIHSGQSSVSVGRQCSSDWNVSLTNPDNNEILAIIALKTGALGASGMKKGAHILDPRTGTPVRPGRCVWVQTETAARADALSTAFMVMKRGEIEKICGSHPGLSACLLEDGHCTDFGLLS